MNTIKYRAGRPRKQSTEGEDDDEDELPTQPTNQNTEADPLDDGDTDDLVNLLTQVSLCFLMI